MIPAMIPAMIPLDVVLLSAPAGPHASAHVPNTTALSWLAPPAQTAPATSLATSPAKTARPLALESVPNLEKFSTRRLQHTQQVQYSGNIGNEIGNISRYNARCATPVSATSGGWDEISFAVCCTRVNNQKTSAAATVASTAGRTLSHHTSPSRARDPSS
jgi:hypothetical protein